MSFIQMTLGEIIQQQTRKLEENIKMFKEKAKEVFEHLIAIDEAAQTRDSAKATKNYQAALRDFDAFFQLIPN
jgi:hypothetical protein